jgi:hypothetical protein
MILVVATVPAADLGEVRDELDSLDPLHLLEAELDLIARRATEMIEDDLVAKRIAASPTPRSSPGPERTTPPLSAAGRLLNVEQKNTDDLLALLQRVGWSRVVAR